MPQRKAKPHWRNKSLARSGEPKQRTKGGLEIPVPTREEWEGAFDRTATKRSEEPSKPAKAKRRTRRAAR